MKKISEKSITNAILKYLNGLPGCYARKTLGNMSNPGEPDISGCIAGRRLEIEVKAPGNKPTKLQERALKRWAATGAITGVAWSLDDAKIILREGLWATAQDAESTGRT
jgi:hypothetical protein